MAPSRTFRYIVSIVFVSFLVIPALGEQDTWRPPPSYSEQKRRVEQRRQDCERPARLPGGVWQPPKPAWCSEPEERESSQLGNPQGSPLDLRHATVGEWRAATGDRKGLAASVWIVSSTWFMASQFGGLPNRFEDIVPYVDYVVKCLDEFAASGETPDDQVWGHVPIRQMAVICTALSTERGSSLEDLIPRVPAPQARQYTMPMRGLHGTLCFGPDTYSSDGKNMHVTCKEPWLLLARGYGSDWEPYYGWYCQPRQYFCTRPVPGSWGCTCRRRDALADGWHKVR